MVLILGLSYAFGWSDGGYDDVKVAQLSQGVNVLWVAIVWTIGWKILPHVPPARTLAENERLWSAGFREVGRTVAILYKDYRRSSFTYFAAVIFAESFSNAFTAVSVIFLDEELGLSSSQIGFFFLIAVVATIPGSQLGGWVTSKINPKRSWMLALFLLSAAAVVGAFCLNRDSVAFAFVWAVCVGILLGWHYPTEGLIFSICLPKCHDSEMAGFFVYCSQVLVWLPPLIFSVLDQGGFDQSFGVLAVASFGLIAVAIISTMPPWPDVVKDVAKMEAVSRETQHGVELSSEQLNATEPKA